MHICIYTYIRFLFFCSADSHLAAWFFPYLYIDIHSYCVRVYTYIHKHAHIHECICTVIYISEFVICCARGKPPRTAKHLSEKMYQPCLSDDSRPTYLVIFCRLPLETHFHYNCSSSYIKKPSHETHPLHLNLCHVNCKYDSHIAIICFCLTEGMFQFEFGLQSSPPTVSVFTITMLRLGASIYGKQSNLNKDQAFRGS